MSVEPTTKLSPPKADYQPPAWKGPSREEVLETRQKHVNPGIFHLYKNPIMVVEGRMQYLWDDTGKQYLDAFGGIVTVSVGHSHPKVNGAVKEQIDHIQHTTTIYLHPNIGMYAKNLSDHFPEGLDVSYFTNSGSEANETAILMARLFTGNETVVALRNAYHGGTTGALGLTAHGTWKYPAGPPQNVMHATPGYCYRCPFGLSYPNCAMKCAHDLDEKLRYESTGKIAAFIGECLQGVGGVVVPPKEYFGIIYETVRKYGGVVIADEVQGGFGRTGEHFWAFENWGVKPDLVTMAKGIANGYACGGVTTRMEIAETMKQRLHFNTYGGNPVSMAAANATLQVIDEENIQQKAKEIGGHLKGRLEALADKHPLIGEVRGMGLMLGVELVRDRKTKEPANTEAVELLELARERGLLLGKGGLFGNVLRIKPPMCLTRDDADFLADVVDEALGIIEEKR
ncbi:aspartate aminotransferase family protein [bacterium]|nr:aspartate aminotransferase family protein [bacterium]